jgi:hypothetical protein
MRKPQNMKAIEPNTEADVTRPSRRRYKNAPPPASEKAMYSVAAYAALPGNTTNSQLVGCNVADCGSASSGMPVASRGLYIASRPRDNSAATIFRNG